MNYNKFLKKKREEVGLSTRGLANKIGVTGSYISMIETGKSKNPPSEKILKKLSEALHMTSSEEEKFFELVDEEILPKRIKDKLEALNKNSRSDKSNIGPIIFEEMINVPVYDSVSAGCQDGLEPNPEPVEYVSLPKRMAKGCVIVNVHGDSMEPTLENGSSVLIKLNAEVGHNEIGVFIYDDEPLVKRYKSFDGKSFLYSDNLEYPPREVREENEFNICGKVIWIMAKP
ncbi:MAG: LexA family transcriptional regulator [Psychrilyobacter sp.]|uniref:XRE family transcriptional regulator n=1 Tax=Psychrilyobacter sp. TaxID=2586924 RepID=UPI003C753F03